MIGDQPEFDFVLLADRAEAVNGKLYMMGGGWDMVVLAKPDDPLTFSIAVGIIVPWNATNVEHSFGIRIEDPDGARLFEVQTRFNLGRPPQVREGAAQRVTLAIPMNLSLEPGNTYAVVASVGEQSKRVPFHVAVAHVYPMLAP